MVVCDGHQVGATGAGDDVAFVGASESAWNEKFGLIGIGDY